MLCLYVLIMFTIFSKAYDNVCVGKAVLFLGMDLSAIGWAFFFFK